MLHRGFRVAPVVGTCFLLISFVFAALRTASGDQSDPASEQGPAQQQSAKEQQATEHSAVPAAQLHVTTRLVQINVIVNDKHGNPVPGLTKEDFLLLDNKKLQSIQLFSVENNRPAPSEAPLPPDTYSNRFAEHGQTPPSVTVILLDGVNTEFADQALARKQVVKFLQQIQPQERIALYWLGNELLVLHEFTSEAAELREALAHFGGESSQERADSNLEDPSLNNPNSSLPAGQTSSREAFRKAFDQRVANQATKNRVRLTVAALIAIAHHVGSLKGRKNLVWVSGTFPFSLGYEKFDLNWANDTGESFFGEIERAAQALTDANIAVYPVDARGLMGRALSAAADSADAHPEFSSDGDEHLPTRVAPGNTETMKILAARTGGKAYYGTNGLSDAMRHALEDSRMTYTLGYYPVGVKWDGSFHNIKVGVKTLRAEVRARSGYFAIPDSTKIPPKSLQNIIWQAAVNNLDATGIGMRVQLHPTTDSGTQTLTAQVHLDLHEIHMDQNDGLWTGAIQSVFLQLSKQGEILHADDETYQLSLPPAVYEQTLVSGLRNTKRIHVLPGAAQFCVVLRDPSNGNMGSLSIPITKYFPAPSKSGNPARTP